MSTTVQDELLASLVPLREFGTWLGRPEVDKLNDSKYANMKELRFKADEGVWRVASLSIRTEMPSDLLPENKSGVSGKKFYQLLIEKALKRYKEHLDNLSTME